MILLDMDKQEIEKYMKRYLKRHKVPKYDEVLRKNGWPFSNRRIEKLYGNWSNFLLIFDIRPKNTRRTYEEVKLIIKKKGDKILSKKYTNNKQKLRIKCGNCGVVYKRNYDEFNRGYQHAYCSTGGIRQPPPAPARTIKPRNCLYCDVIFRPKHNIGKLCSVDCRKAYEKLDVQREKKRIYGSIGGKKSAAIQSRRSKNEIYFAEQCKEVYGEDSVVTNKQMFGKWDADVVITTLKIAVLWNGIWHYKKVRNKHNVEDVQRRDSEKIAKIRDCGYIPYVIKDMGKHDKKFVDNEFGVFMAYTMLLMDKRMSAEYDTESENSE